MKQEIDYVGSADIASRCGVSRSAPGARERRDPEFPERLATINAGDDGNGIGVWDWNDLEPYCRKIGWLELQDGHLYDPATGIDITDKALAKQQRRKVRT